MVRATHLRRLLFFTVMAALGIVGLGYRLWTIQVTHHDRYSRIAGGNTHRTISREPCRGDILDVNGHPLATSVPVKRVLANPSFIGRYTNEVARVLAPLLAYDPRQLVLHLRPTYVDSGGRLKARQYFNFRRKVTEVQWQQITQAMARIRLPVDESSLSSADRRAIRVLRNQAIYAEEDTRRYYPGGRLASHVLGYVREIERPYTNHLGHRVQIETVGINGTENWCDTKLKGTRGWRVTETAPRMKELVVYRKQDVPPRAGFDVRLTVDSVIQRFVEAQLADAMARHSPASASAIVIRPRTGEILAMASLPDFDPIQPGKASDFARRNRVITDIFEPGSTFKIVVVSGALNDHAVTLDDTFFCENGSFHYRGRRLRDHGEYGTLTVRQIITKSSNIGAAKIGINRLGKRRLHDYILNFGFGKRTGVTLSGEVRGIVNPPNRWDGLAISRIPMGQSVSVTPLQMVMAMSAIANGGRLMRPMLIKSLHEGDGAPYTVYRPQRVRQVISPEAARMMTEALKTVTAEGGTALKAALVHFTVAGKTGTAQKVINGVYAPGKYVASFIGFFPADEPEVCIMVMLDEPDRRKGYYGGQVAGPYFKAMAEFIADRLKIRPDRISPVDAQPASIAGAASTPEAVRTISLQTR